MSIRDPEAAFKAIRERFKPVELGPKIGLTPQRISQWKKIPAERVLEVERATGIPREELRPDLYAPRGEVAA